MKFYCALLLLALPAFADSIPQPIMSFASTQGWFCNYDPEPGSFDCLSNSYNEGHNTAIIYSNRLYIPIEARNLISGIVTSDAFKGDLISGTFTGDEFRPGPDKGLYEYAVTGTYQINWAGQQKPGSTVTLTITSAQFMGRVGTTPEPETWALMATGAVGIFSVAWGKRSLT